MSAFACGGRSKDCMGDGVDFASNFGDQFTIMRQCINNLNSRFSHVEDNLDNLCQSVSVTYQSIKRIELQLENKDDAMSSKAGFDRLLAAHIHPLSSALEQLPSQISQTVQSISKAAPQTDFLLTRMQAKMEHGFSELLHQKNDQVFGSTDRHGIAVSDIDLDDKIAKHKLQVLLHEEFMVFQKAVIAELKAQEELQKRALLPEILSSQQTTLAELKKHQDSVQLETLEQLLDKFTTVGVSKTEEKLVSGMAVPGDLPLLVYPTESIEKESLVVEEPRATTTIERAYSLSHNSFASREDHDHIEHIELKEDCSLVSVFLSGDRVDRPPYNIEDYYKERGCAQALCRSNNFQSLAMFVVCLNTVWVGIEAEVNPNSSIYTQATGYLLVSQAFNIFWFIELVIHWLAFRHTSDALRDGWFRFDAFLVATMVLDAWILGPILAIASSHGSRLPISTQPLRMMRAVKLIRMAKLTHWLPELTVMLKGMWRSGRAISATLILILMMNYLWGILMFMLLYGNDEGSKNMMKDLGYEFESIGRSMWSLFIGGTLMLDNSAQLMTELCFNRLFHVQVAGLFFFMYSLVSALLILQMLIGVLCDVVAHVNRETRDSVAIGLIRQELLAKICDADEDGDGMISQKELLHAITDKRATAVFNQVGINRGFLFQLQESIYAKEESITVKKALDLVLLARSDNYATIEALAGGFSFILTEMQKHFSQTMSDHTNALQKHFTCL